MQVVSSTQTVYLGTDYVSGFANALDFTHDAWTNLASGTVQMVDQQGTLIKQGTVVTSGASGDQTVRVQLSVADLDALGRGRHLTLVRCLLGSQYYALADCVLVVR